MRVDPLAIVRRRLARQRLIGEPFADVDQAIRFLVAVQGQDYAEAKWSLAERLDGIADADLDAAFDAGVFLRTHVMRPTWHLVAADDLPWLLELTAPRVHAALGYAYRRFELDEDVFARGHEALAAALEPGEPLQRDSLMTAMRDAGITGERLRLHHVLIHAELEGLVCSGPRQGKQHTYALLADRSPNPRRLEPDAALAELTRRYFAGHGPATVADFSWWSGLTIAQAKRGLELAGLGADDEGWFGLDAAEPEAAEEDTALLVGMFDESVIAYRDLRFAFATGVDGLDPLIRPIVIGGRTVGTWKRVVGRGGVTVEASTLERLGRTEAGALEAAAERLGRFLGLPATLSLEPRV